MKRELERNIEQGALKAVFKLGVLSIKLVGGGGQPDRMFIIPGGRPLFIEFKRPGGVLSKTQEFTIRRLRHYGYRVEVCFTVAAAVAAVQAALDAAALPEKSL